MNNLQLILGGPGCGKTTRLLAIIEEEMRWGIAPNEIAFVAFTKAAATEAAERAATKFNLKPDDLPWFRTIHSLAYQKLGMQRDEVMDKRDWKAFGEMVGEPVTGYFEGDSFGMTGRRGDQMLRLIDYAATTMVPLEEVWHELEEPVDWYWLKRFDAALRGYKNETGKMDFTDMVLTYAREGDPLKVKVAVIDEGQDLTRSQWAAVERAFGNAERIYVGGDDDQAIYKWAGADVEHFLSLTTTPEVLPLSHRLPEEVFNLAGKVSKRIQHRYRKPYATTGRRGHIEYHQAPEYVDFSMGTWLLLARNNYMLSNLEDVVRSAGYNYSTRKGGAVDLKDVEAIKIWEGLRSGKRTDVSAAEARSLHAALGRPKPSLKELARYTPAELEYNIIPMWRDALTGISFKDREYYASLLRRGEKLSNTPRIRIETIHGVKGAEADNVLLMTDISSRTARGFEKAPDHEHRVFYVGVTRAKQALHIVAPQTDSFYPL